MLRRFHLALVLLLAIAAAARADAPRYLKLTILHTNDQHTHLLPFDDTFTPAEGVVPSVGGAARRATMVAKIRKETTTPVLLVDVGDTIVNAGPGDKLGAYHGKPTIAAMNAMRYDVMEPGNHEFQ